MPHNRSGFLPGEDFSRGAQPQRGRSTSPNVGSLEQILSERFRPELERTEGQQSTLENLFLDRVRNPADLEAFRGEITAFGESLVNDLFGGGGAVERGLQEARGRTVETGFGTTSGGLTNARNNIFSRATDTVAQGIAQKSFEFADLAERTRGSDIQSLLAGVGLQASRGDDLRESLFGGRATIDQQGFDRETMALNRRLIEHALRGGGIGSRFGGAASGALSGAAAGSVIPGIGTVAGGVLGGLAGIFG